MNFNTIITGFITTLIGIILYGVELPNADYLIFGVLRLGALIDLLGALGILAGVIVMVVGAFQDNPHRR